MFRKLLFILIVLLAGCAETHVGASGGSTSGRMGISTGIAF